jgi:8-oxo-dGTP pyrophosphatase MutT (NUDIX family)
MWRGKGVTRAEIERRLRLYRPSDEPRTSLPKRGDHQLNDGQDPPSNPRPASVLVPLIEREPGLTVLLTQRTADLPSHAGQVAFPGGRWQASDADNIATALRETQEEVGLMPDRIDVVGRLDTYLTGTGFAVTPIVGFVRPPFALQADPREVADIFEVPLAFFLDPAHHELRSAVWGGRERRFYVMPYENRYIWGATAGMLKNLYDVLIADAQPAAAS